MAVATHGRKTQPRRAGERDVDIVLSRSSVNLANLVTVGRLLMVIPLVWLILTERLQAAFWLFVAPTRFCSTASTSPSRWASGCPPGWSPW